MFWCAIVQAMETFELDSTQDIRSQVADLQGSAQPTDCIAVTQVTDFQLLLADVEEGRFDSIEDALHQGFVGFGVTEGAYFEFEDVRSSTELEIRYVTALAPLFEELD